MDFQFVDTPQGKKMNDYLSSKKGISTIMGVVLGIIYVAVCAWNEKLISLNGFAMFVIGLLGAHVVGQSLIDHKNAGAPPVQPVQGESK